MKEMYNKEQTVIARYVRIALDIATKIASGEIPEGKKLKGRSVLSTEYKVSSETIRRSMSLLADKDVVTINAGSGIIVLSRTKAIQFTEDLKGDQTLAQMNSKLQSLIENRKSLDEEISLAANQLVDMYKFKRSDLITPVEIVLPENSHVIGKSIGNLQVWHNTGATIIGIIRHTSVIISPGPYFEFAPKDRVLIVGDENVVERFNVYVKAIR